MTATPDSESNPKTAVYTCPVDHEGTSLFVRGWVVSESKFQPLVLVHDIGQSSSDLHETASLLTKRGYTVYVYDLRGHGHSGSRLGHIDSFDVLARDLLQIVAWVRHIHQGEKPIIISHGMGGLISLFFTRFYSRFTASQVLVAPTLNLIETIRPYRRLIIRTLAEITPNMTLPNRICPAFTETEHRKKPHLSNYTTQELLNALTQSRKLLQRLSVPTLFLCPEKTKISRFDNLQKLIAKNKDHQELDFLFFKPERVSSNHFLSSPTALELGNIIESITHWIEKRNFQ